MSRWIEKEIIQSVGIAIFSALLVSMPVGADAQQVPGVPGHSSSSSDEDLSDVIQSGELHGRIIDAETSRPIGGAQVRLRGLGHAGLTHPDGRFHLSRVPEGVQTVVVQRIGYAPEESQVEVIAGDTVNVEILLEPSAFDLPGIVVTAAGREQSASDVYRPTSVLDGGELRRQLESSLAATLDSEPGISQRYNGPAASQPVIRGLSGDRVLVLEDGGRTGDVSSTSSDHAVSVDPAGAERIEVVRGPAALLYGSNALGGVINVIREDVPRTLPEHVGGTFSLQGESVNEGLATSAALTGGVGSIAWRAAGGLRRANDTRTPLGDLPSSSMEGYDAGAGLSWVHPNGFAGFSLRDYALEYGVPGSFGGETIPGAHEGGVTIDMRRISGNGRAAWFNDVGPFNAIEADAGYVWYHHRELESDGSVGTEFGQLTGSGRVIARHSHDNGSTQTDGAIGFSAMGRDFNVAGLNTGSHPAEEYTIAGFGYEEIAWGQFRLQVGGRYDWSRIDPDGTGHSHDHDHGHDDHGHDHDDHGHDPADIGEIRTRTFGAVSGSIAALYEVREGLNIGLSAARAFRTPSIGELYSDGPHLADYSFNIGNPDLDPEFGLGFDAFARLSSRRVQAELGVYHNTISDYIFYAPTGEMDPRQGRFPLYRASQEDAVLRGAEGKVQWEAFPELVVHGQASYVHAERKDTKEPLPEIPPLEAAVGLRYSKSDWFAGISWTGAAEQDRVAEFELPTSGYGLVDITAGIRFMRWGYLHSVTLGIDNVADTVWRDHLSRIRAVAPQPGRNVRLLYRVNL